MNTNQYEDRVIDELGKSVDAIRELRNSRKLICKMALTIADSLKKGNKILLLGNGGSAGDAQHIAAELAGKFKLERRALPAIALTTNSSILTAIANDYSYDDVFVRQVEALANSGDIVIGISTSGNSANVISAVNKAKENGAITIGFSGKCGKLNEISDICLVINSSDTPHIQEAHITAGHILCGLIEEIMFGG